MLDALVAVLQGLDGLTYVDRQGITPELVADTQMPSVLVDEVRTQYRWYDRHGGRSIGATCALVLDLQARATRRTSGQGPNISTARELFVNAVLNHLANNPTLNTQLDGEAEAADHARDIATRFDVRYVRAPAPYVRALVTIEAEPCVERFDDRTKTDWQQLIVNTWTDRDIGDSVETTYDLT